MVEEEVVLGQKFFWAQEGQREETATVMGASRGVRRGWERVEMGAEGGLSGTIEGLRAMGGDRRGTAGSRRHRDRDWSGAQWEASSRRRGIGEGAMPLAGAGVLVLLHSCGGPGGTTGMPHASAVSWFKNWLIRALLFSTNGFKVIMYASLAYEGLFARF